jgi:hypothetical protein
VCGPQRFPQEMKDNLDINSIILVSKNVFVLTENNELFTKYSKINKHHKMRHKKNKVLRYYSCELSRKAWDSA